MKVLSLSSLAQIQPGTKILFANVPGDGHFNPLTGVAKHLQSLGCDILWYTSKTFIPRIEKLGIPYVPFDKALEVDGENLEEIFPERKNLKSTVKKFNYDLINFFILRSTEYFEDISNIKKVFDFDLMIADSAFSAIPLVKEKLEVPVIAISVFPLSETSKDLPPYGLGMTPSKTVLGRLKQDLLRIIADKILFIKPYKVMKSILDSYGIQSTSSNLFDLIVRKSTLLLQSGTPGFEYFRSDVGKNIRFIGPLLPYSSNKKADRWTNQKLKIYKKVVLVTQGTVEKDVQKILVPTLEAFKGSKDILVVVTTGGSGTEELRKLYPQENILIEDFIPFSDIMPFTDVYITNGGYGGVMLGIQNNLPMVVSGLHEGKNEITARIGFFKLGVNLQKDRPSSAQIKRGVEEVFSNPEYKANVQRLAKEFGEYDPNSLIASYVAGIVQKKSYFAKNKLIRRNEVEYKIY